MSMSDPIAAMLTIIRNGQMVNKTFVCTDMSNTKKAIVTLAPGNTIDLSAGV